MRDEELLFSVGKVSIAITHKLMDQIEAFTGTLSTDPDVAESIAPTIVILLVELRAKQMALRPNPRRMIDALEDQVRQSFREARATVSH